MKMNPMDFMETLGEVRETYVEEVLDAKEGRGAIGQRQRWSPLPAFGILCGAAACAVMVFGIWSVKHPEAMRRTPAADSAGSSKEQSAAEQELTVLVPAAQTEIITELETTTKADGETESGIIAEIKEGTLTAAGCTLILTNRSDSVMCFGVCWEVADAATGKALVPDQMMEWTDLAWELESGASQEITVNWEPYYGELPDGGYLFRFGDAGIWHISVPFEIAGGQTAQTAATTVTTVTVTDTTPVVTATVTTVTAVTSAAAQPKENTENTGSVSLIASFRLDMGYEPARLTEEESAHIYALIDALELTPIPEYEGSQRASELSGGWYYIETDNRTWKLWNEKLIYQNGQWYTDEGDTVKAFLDEVIRLIGKYQP